MTRGTCCFVEGRLTAGCGQPALRRCAIRGRAVTEARHLREVPGAGEIARGRAARLGSRALQRGNAEQGRYGAMRPYANMRMPCRGGPQVAARNEWANAIRPGGMTSSRPTHRNVGICMEGSERSRPTAPNVSVHRAETMLKEPFWGGRSRRIAPTLYRLVSRRGEPKCSPGMSGRMRFAPAG